MSEKKEVESLLSNIAEQATAADIKSHSAVRTKEFGGWNGATDLTPYKKANSWPGSKYCLMGNSFNVELKGALEADTKDRMKAIQTLLSSNESSCVAVRDALKNEYFVANLSRFERDWLTRLPEETVIGKAYDQIGTPIQEAFSVWRKDFVPNRTSRTGLLAK